MFLCHELKRAVSWVRATVCVYTAARQPERRWRVESDGGKGPGETIGEGVLIYKDAVPKTGTRLTKRQITKRFRTMSNFPKRKRAEGS